jgi:hypothetical protein
MIGGLRAITPPFEAAYRIIPSRFPPVGVFDGLVSGKDLELLFEIEARTNERLREDIGSLHLVEPADWVVGPGATIIMGAFTHPSIAGSRFSDGSFGIYYCAGSSDTAVRETAHHRATFLRLTQERPCRIEMRQYVGTLVSKLLDGRRRLPARALDADDYSVSQPIGGQLREAGAYGLIYPSVRNRGGLCAALFRPPAITNVVQSQMYQYLFDGEQISDVLPVGDAIPLLGGRPT